MAEKRLNYTANEINELLNIVYLFTDSPEANDPYYLPEIGTPNTPNVPVGITISTRNASFTETTTMILQINLNTVPSENVTISFSTNGNVTLDKKSMTFTQENWNTIQYLDLSYKGEDLTSDLTDVININATGGNYNGLTDIINVTIKAENSNNGGNTGDDTNENALLTMRTATVEDYLASGYLSDIIIDSDGVVSGTNTGVSYPILAVSGSGNTTALEWEAHSGSGLWIICGKSSTDGSYIGFGDASMGALSYSGKFVDGNCSPISGVNAETNIPLTLGVGNKYHANRIGTIFSVYQSVNDAWELRFKIDLSTYANFNASDYDVNVIGVLVGASYQVIKNTKVYGG